MFTYSNTYVTYVYMIKTFRWLDPRKKKVVHLPPHHLKCVDTTVETAKVWSTCASPGNSGLFIFFLLISSFTVSPYIAGSLKVLQWYCLPWIHAKLSIAQVNLTEQQLLLRGERMCQQSIMPPHDILASLYEFPDIYHPLITGEPGRIGQYWRENEDLLSKLDVPNLEPWYVISNGSFSPHQDSPKLIFVAGIFFRTICQDPSKCVPLRVYGDGADAQQHFEVFTILPIMGCSSSTLDTRLLCSVRNTERTTNEARKRIVEILAWSFEALRN